MRTIFRFFLSTSIFTFGFWSLVYLALTYIPHLFAQPAVLVVSTYGETNKQISQSATMLPVKVQFPTLSLTLPIKPAAVVGNQWDTYEDAVSWLSTSGTFISGGNIVLFGHNKKHTLGRLGDLEMGNTIILYSDRGDKSYKVLEKVEVKPTELKYVLNTQDRLTIYTCSGPFDSRRLFVIAVPVSS